MTNKMRQKFLTITLILLLMIATFPSSALAGDISSSDQWMVITKYEVGGALVTYYIVITNWYRIQYTTSTSGTHITYTANPQTQGGVIKNGQTPGYFPFSQTISRAWVKHYKDYNYYKSYEFTVDDSGSISDPDNLPYGFKYTSNVYLYGDNYNEMQPFVYWVANGTLPSYKTLQGESLFL